MLYQVNEKFKATLTLENNKDIIITNEVVYTLIVKLYEDYNVEITEDIVKKVENIETLKLRNMLKDEGKLKNFIETLEVR